MDPSDACDRCGVPDINMLIINTVVPKTDKNRIMMDAGVLYLCPSCYAELVKWLKKEP